MVVLSASVAIAQPKQVSGLKGNAIILDRIEADSRKVHLKRVSLSPDTHLPLKVEIVESVTTGNEGEFSFNFGGRPTENSTYHFIEVELADGDQLVRDWSLVGEVSGQSKLPFPVNRSPFFRWDDPGQVIWFTDRGNKSDVSPSQKENLLTFQIKPQKKPTTSIKIDSKMADWSEIPLLASDIQESSNAHDLADWKGLSITHNQSFVFIKLESWRSVRPSHGVNIFVDTDFWDKRSLRGLQAYASGDFLIQEKLFYRYGGDGTSWEWDAISTLNAGYGDNSMECAIGIRGIGAPAAIRILCMGDNKAFGAKGSGFTDWFPHSESDQNKPGYGIVYIINPDQLSLEVKAPKSPTLAADTESKKLPDTYLKKGMKISLDGQRDDWESIPVSASDPDDIDYPGTEVDWRNFWVAKDDFHVYLAFENDTPIDLENNEWAYSIFIDQDGKKETGFRGPLNDYPLGAEFILQGKFIHRYNGSGNDWSWKFMKGLSSGSSSNFFELQIPRQIFSEDATRLHFFLVGQNSAFGKYRDVDYVPDDKFEPIRMDLYF